MLPAGSAGRTGRTHATGHPRPTRRMTTTTIAAATASRGAVVGSARSSTSIEEHLRASVGAGLPWRPRPTAPDRSGANALRHGGVTVYEAALTAWFNIVSGMA